MSTFRAPPPVCPGCGGEPEHGSVFCSMACRSRLAERVAVAQAEKKIRRQGGGLISDGLPKPPGWKSLKERPSMGHWPPSERGVVV